MEESSAPTFVNAESESTTGERGKNRCNKALYILNWLEKIGESKDDAQRKMRADFLLKEVSEQAHQWQIGTRNDRDEERNTGGTEGESVALLSGLSVLKEFPTFEKTPKTSLANYVDINKEEVIVSFNIKNPDNFEVKRATYIFSTDPSVIKAATDKIEIQRQEFVKKEYGWKKVGSALKLLKEMGSDASGK